MKRPMNKAYGVLSGHYEELAASDGYREWAEYVLKEVGENAKGKTGCDAFGDMIASIAAGYGAEGGLIRKEGESTSYSVVLIPDCRIVPADPSAPIPSGWPKLHFASVVSENRKEDDLHSRG